jgi:hypothetical protein
MFNLQCSGFARSPWSLKMDFYQRTKARSVARATFSLGVETSDHRTCGDGPRTRPRAPSSLEGPQSGVSNGIRWPPASSKRPATPISAVRIADDLCVLRGILAVRQAAQWNVMFNVHLATAFAVSEAINFGTSAAPERFSEAAGAQGCFYPPQIRPNAISGRIEFERRCFNSGLNP